GAYGGREAKRHAQFAKDAGCQAVMCLPPNAYRADDRAVLEHFELVASAGLPVTAYNNPVDTKVDLRPDLLAKL
ncbi:dihydrodipicolinate synthase family protein, partial [Streptomyces sp. SID6648]|nr:dihydrodipicolinate synthase family protein [Streptomyces sp. SID6648]